MNPKVDQYLLDGCMRCKYGGTPLCKVNNWRMELETLRHLVLECGLNEEIKWGVPCYTSNGKDIVIVSAFMDYASMSFFKGALLEDPYNILVKQGENSQSGRLIKFTNTDQIIEQHALIRSYILESMKL